MGGVSSRLYRNQTGSELGKRIRWAAETKLDPNLGSHLSTRNTLMNEPVANLANPYPQRTDILHEYFVAPDRFGDFLQGVPGGDPAGESRVPERDAALCRRRPGLGAGAFAGDAHRRGDVAFAGNLARGRGRHAAPDRAA